MKSISLCTVIFLISFACSAPKKKKPEETAPVYETTGEVIRLQKAMDRIVPEDAEIEILAEGFSWTEGPVWVEELNALLFSDVPENKIFKWEEGTGVFLYLEPSGYTDTIPRGGETGSNGLALDNDDHLILNQCGNRQVARMDAPLDQPAPDFSSLASGYDGKRFNSPNDLVVASDGSIYFTDPPYGLEYQEKDPAKEMEYQGVYLIKEGETLLLIDTLTRPNGIGLSPDESKLYVANSDQGKAIWAVYDLDENGMITSGKIFYDATKKAKEATGLPDGMKVHPNGLIFATGPGGVHIFTPEAELLGIIDTQSFVSNCAFNTDFSYLYMTVDDKIMRVELNKTNQKPIIKNQ